MKAVNNYKEGKGEYQDIINEAVQVGAMAIRFLLNLKEVDQ